MKGTVIEPRVGNTETPEEQKQFLKPHSYFIRGEDQKIYFAHAGDLKENENTRHSQLSWLISSSN